MRDSSAISAPQHPQRGRSRWIATGSVAVILAACGGSSNPSADGTQPATPAPSAAPSVAPAGTAVVPTTVAAGDVPTLVSRLADDDTVCLSLSASSAAGAPLGGEGCVGREELSTARTYLVAADGAAWRVDTSSPDVPVEGVVRVGHDEECGTAVAGLPPVGWFEHTACSDSGPIVRALPDDPAGSSSYTVVSALSGDTIELTALDAEAPSGVTLFEAIIPLGGTDDARCLVVVNRHTDGWHEACALESDRGGSYVVELDGSYAALDDADPPRLVPLDDGATVRTNGCADPVAEVLQDHGIVPMVMVRLLACDGDQAAVLFPAVFLQVGPRDGGLSTFARDVDGRWVLTDSGTGIEPDPWPLPIPPTEWISTGPDELAPVDVTGELRQRAGDASSARDIADAAAAALSPDDDVRAPVVTLLDGVPLIVVDVAYADDSIGAGTYAIWLEDRDGVTVIGRAFRIDRCTRGRAAPDTCI